jgi:hypothetical protein
MLSGSKVNLYHLPGHTIRSAASFFDKPQLSIDKPSEWVLSSFSCATSNSSTDRFWVIVCLHQKSKQNEKAI